MIFSIITSIIIQFTPKIRAELFTPAYNMGGISNAEARDRFYNPNYPLGSPSYSGYAGYAGSSGYAGSLSRSSSSYSRRSSSSSYGSSSPYSLN